MPAVWKEIQGIFNPCSGRRFPGNFQRPLARKTPPELGNGVRGLRKFIRGSGIGRERELYVKIRVGVSGKSLDWIVVSRIPGSVGSRCTYR